MDYHKKTMQQSFDGNKTLRPFIWSYTDREESITRFSFEVILQFLKVRR